MFGSKNLSKNKQKLIKTSAIQINSLNDTNNILYDISPLPENESHDILPILSLDGRDSSDIIQNDDDDLLFETNNYQPVGDK